MNFVIFLGFLGIVNNCDFQNIYLASPIDNKVDSACQSMLDNDRVKMKGLLIPQSEKLEHRRLQLKQNQSLTNLLSPFGISDNEIALISRAMSVYIKASNLRAGLDIDIKLQRKNLVELSFRLGFNQKLTLVRGDKHWNASINKLAISTSKSISQGMIKGSLYQSVKQLKSTQHEVPEAIYHQYTSLISHFVDLKRDLRAGDQFYLSYTTKTLQDNPKISQAGIIEYAELKQKNRTVRLYRYEIDDEANYYDELGHLVGGFLIKTPVKGGLISSYYGQRKHPVLGYTRIHKGLDFSAPKGTPVIAAGKGKVISAGWSNSFGNVVKLQHQNGYQTLYAHLNKIDQNIKNGKNITQGEIIGFLGSTGLTSGRHLHYEIHKNGRAINPVLIKSKLVSRIDKRHLQKFKDYVESYNAGLIAFKS